MRQLFLWVRGQMANFDDVMFMTGAAAGYADICSTHQARGLDAGVGRSSLLLGPIGHA